MTLPYMSAVVDGTINYNLKTSRKPSLVGRLFLILGNFYFT